MSEIEKMYENAELLYCNKCRHDSEIDCIYMCESKYPPFTAEKQIEIIKLLTQQSDLTISHFEKWELWLFDGQEYTQITGKDFTETLAKFINAYWKNLTETEKAEIRGILE